MSTGLALQQLPDSLLQYLVRKLDALSTAALACTCREFREVCSDEGLWKQRCLERWKLRMTELWKSETLAGTYKRLYGTKHKV